MAKLEIISWGKKHGKVPDGFIAVDCTALRNPYLVPELKKLNGLSKKVITFVKKPPDSNPDALKFILDYAAMVVEKRHKHQIAFVCLGGRHRSVVMAGLFATARRKLGDNVTVTHFYLG